MLLAALLAAGIGLQLANPQLARTFVDNAEQGAPFDRLLRIAGAFLAVALLTQLATIAETYVAEDLGWRTTNALRQDLTQHVLLLDDSFHAEHGAGELIERIDGDVSAIATFFGRFVVNVLGSAVFLAGVLVLLWREDGRVGAVLTVFAAIATAFMMRGGGFVSTRSRAARQADADLSAFLEERLAGLPDIKANGGDDDTMRRLHERLAARFRHGRYAVLGASMFSSTVNALFVAGTATALTTSAVLHRSGVLTVGSVLLVFRYTGMLRMPLERLARHMNSFQQATGAIVRVRQLLAIESRVVDAGRSLVPTNGALSVELEGVSFAYEDGAEPVVRDVSLRVAPGEVLGLLGRTGSGKTTLSRLVFRLHDVTDGVIRVGGVDVRDVRLADLRGRIGLVTQDVQLFAGTLRDNVTLFDRTTTDEQLTAVFAALDLAEWLDELPDGLDTVLGATGRGLSAGEAQLVALTRVFLTDPGLVVLDEASSRLDPHTERLLERAIGNLLHGRTGIVIAHRLDTVRQVDSILVLDAGTVAEYGRRHDLAGDPESHFSRLLRAGGLEEVRP
jgi:ABC-type multidrug transport system fused ATPase/permease subunit